MDFFPYLFLPAAIRLVDRDALSRMFLIQLTLRPLFSAIPRTVITRKVGRITKATRLAIEMNRVVVVSSEVSSQSTKKQKQQQQELDDRQSSSSERLESEGRRLM